MDVEWTAKPHAFGGAVLSPKHARELTPSLCLAIASSLSELEYSRVPYTVWITEAWRVLGWAEPSAALFWEMATLYHTLFGAAQSIPPILSCGSTSSMGSNTTPLSSATKKQYATNSAKELPAWLVGLFLLLHCEECAHQRNLAQEQHDATPMLNDLYISQNTLR